MVLAKTLSMTDFISIKFVQDGFQNKSQNNIGITVWTSVTTLFAGIMRKVMPFCVALSLVMKHGATIISWRANTKVWNGNSQHPLMKKKFKSQLTAGRVIVTLFWDSK
jgi:hypothetical protein